MKATQNKKNTLELIHSLETVYQLKSIPRTGWIQSGIDPGQVESIAGHSYGMSILILYLRPSLLANGVNVERALNMALIHDIAEALVGDITPHDNVSLDQKYNEEVAAFRQITQHVAEGEYFQELWDDFESVGSIEAQVVKRIDKLDMLMQAYLYEKKYSIRLDSFWENMEELFKDSESEPIYNYIRLNRFEIKGN